MDKVHKVHKVFRMDRVDKMVTTGWTRWRYLGFSSISQFYLKLQSSFWSKSAIIYVKDNLPNNFFLDRL